MRHCLFASEPLEIIEHRGDERLSAGALRGQGAGERLSRYRAFWAASHQFVDCAASRLRSNSSCRRRKGSAASLEAAGVEFTNGDQPGVRLREGGSER